MKQQRGGRQRKVHQKPQGPGQRGVYGSGQLAGIRDPEPVRPVWLQGENTPVKISALDNLRARIADIEYQEDWEAKVEVHSPFPWCPMTRTVHVQTNHHDVKWH